MEAMILFKYAEWHSEMKSEYTILAPQLSPIHWQLLEQVFIDAGFNFRIVKTISREAVQHGQRLVHNDMCHPAIMTVGSVVDAALNLKDEQGNPVEKVAIIMTQTGGGCRASQYLWMIRRALADEGREDIPVIPLSFAPSNGEVWNQLGLKIRDLRRAMYAILLGDVLMTALHKIRPYEETQGDCDQLLDAWIDRLRADTFARMNGKQFRRLSDQIIRDFSNVAKRQPLGAKPLVGVVGEIWLKYNHDGNNHLVNQLEQEGCEAMVTPLIDFFLYCLSGPVFQHKLLARSVWGSIGTRALIRIIEKYKATVNHLFAEYFPQQKVHWPSIYQLSEKVQDVVSLVNTMGEGWLLSAEMIDLIEQNCQHIVIAQPFGCLANHAAGAGTIATIKERFPSSHIESINYDASASATNQLNRIKLLVAGARRLFAETQMATKTSKPQESPAFRVGIDIGSTTVKIVVLNRDGKIVFKRYVRHGADVKATMRQLLTEAKESLGDARFTVAITGSGALSLGAALNILFIQEVDASSLTIQRLHPHIDAVVELGGEDAKVIIFRNGQVELTMNDICAGGTGAFIDQMAALLGTDASGLNELAKRATKTHAIASRCGVFAKTDIQVLLNGNAASEDIAKSVLVAIVNQTLGNLMKGRREDCRNVALLGGPLRFLSELRNAFVDKLAPAKVDLTLEDTEYYVALGAALASEDNPDDDCFPQILDRLERAVLESNLGRLPRLFDSPAELEAFRGRHKTGLSHAAYISGEPIYIGVDAGSTTVKAVAINEQKQVVYSTYLPNDGKLKWHIERLKQELGGYHAKHTVAIGYGEKNMIDSGLADSGEVETVAHLRAAKLLNPKVGFIIDIGGQDIKVFWVRSGSISKIELNEACSSGCGSFIKTFADALGLSLDEFDSLACTGTSPVDLGTRCTVFMNSLTKQAQKEGIGIADIAAGIAYSVVRNALYKVIKLTPDLSLGENVIVQGGTFLNDSVLRAFEIETGTAVIRPEIAGLMGAYGAALLAMERANDVKLWQKFAPSTTDVPNLVETKLELLTQRDSKDFWPVGQSQPKGAIGIPFALNLYENYPYWHALFSSLGYQVVLSPISDSNTYKSALDTIFSGTVCYPAKLLHGHLMALLGQSVDLIWAPMLKWEKPEREQRNHFNCPVVAFYPEAAMHNLPAFKNSTTRIHTEPLPYDKPEMIARYLSNLDFLSGFSQQELGRALKVAEQENANFKSAIRAAGRTALEWVKQNNGHGIVLAGHPYHIDPEVHHGIPRLITDLGLAVFTEDSVAWLAENGELRVSDQWVYHRRLYDAARFVSEQMRLDLVQLVSFGCGLDAVTSDMVRDILEDAGKIYTQLKLDEMSARRPALIRIRSLLYALRELGAL